MWAPKIKKSTIVSSSSSFRAWFPSARRRRPLSQKPSIPKSMKRSEVGDITGDGIGSEVDCCLDQSFVIMLAYSNWDNRQCLVALCPKNGFSYILTFPLGWMWLFIRTRIILLLNRSGMEIDHFLSSHSEDAECRWEDLILSFLLIRQTGFESSSLTYEKWFSASFGSLATTKAKSKRSFGLLVKFLSSLVPYEPASFLKVRERRRGDHCKHVNSSVSSKLATS